MQRCVREWRYTMVQHFRAYAFSQPPEHKILMQSGHPYQYLYGGSTIATGFENQQVIVFSSTTALHKLDCYLLIF